jgi:hypothetical protein
MLSDLVFRLRSLFPRNTVEAELDDELRFHFEQQVEKCIRSGMTREEARRQARLSVGGIDQVKEECREKRGRRGRTPQSLSAQFAKSTGKHVRITAIRKLAVEAADNGCWHRSWRPSSLCPPSWLRGSEISRGRGTA